MISKQLVLTIFCSFCCFFSQISSLYSWDWDAYIQFLSGYRRDQIATTIDSFNNPEVLGFDTTLIATDHLKAKNLLIFENGLYGEFYLCRWFIRGWGTYGNVKHGKYVETVHVPGTAKNSDTVTRAHIRQGRVWDISPSLGYVFPIWGCQDTDCMYITLAPLVGYSWNYQRVKMNNATTHTGLVTPSPLPTLDGLQYKNRWRGPWFGLEVNFSNPWIELKGGYEYHWPHWRAEWLLAGPDVTGVAYSDKRHGHIYFGSNAYFDARYYLFEGLYVESGISFKYWRSRKGKEVPLAGSFSAVGIADTQVDIVRRALWKSFEAQISMGYLF